MEAALGWLGTIFEAVLNLFPRLTILRAPHEAVKWRNGKEAIRVPKGLCFYWPLVTEIERIVVSRQTINLPTQVLETKDGKSVVVGSFAVYSIYDVVKAIGERNWDVDDTVANICMAAVVEVVTAHTVDELREGVAEGRNSKINRALTMTCRKQLRQFGVQIQRCGITDFSQSKVYRLVGDETIKRLGQ